MIHRAAPPNDLAAHELRIAPGEAVTPERAGWRYLAFAVEQIEEPRRIGRAGHESALVVLGGGGLRVGEQKLAGRRSVWDGPAWAVYLPPGSDAIVSPVGSSVTVAIAEAPASDRAAAADGPRVIGPQEVAIEVRGAGSATRQVNHIITPDFPAERLEIVEVYTPSGNWSSWPPHKHDVDDMPHEAVLEEVYCYQFRRPEAWGLQRLYRRDGSRDASWAVRHGEVVLVTDGYHPFVATHGDDAYYLNVLAGDRRTMACSFDPDLDWVRDAWAQMQPDPRLPLVAGGPQAR